MKNCYLLDQEILYIARFEYKYFLRKNNVLGVGLGYKIKLGKNTNQKCLKVFVKKKLPLRQIYNKDVVCPYYKGIPTDVVEIGIVRSFYLTDRIRPVLGGYSIGPRRGSLGGTLGCMVEDGQHSYILANSHVLASKGVKTGDPIIQPSRYYGGHADTDTIANLYRYIELKYMTCTQQPENRVDCAIAKILNSSLVSSKIALVGDVKGIAQPRLKQAVKKVGAITELTKGEIIAVGTTIEVQYDEGKCLFVDQISTTTMAEEGDSGALLLDENSKALGLLMSGSSSSSTFNPISAVLNNLNVRIVTG